MHLLFLDESGKPGEKAFAIGGVAVRADEWGVLCDRWRGSLADHGWPHDKEVKWHLIRTGMIPPTVADALFAVLADSPIVCSVVVLRPLAGRQVVPRFFTDDDETYATGLMLLAERARRWFKQLEPRLAHHPDTGALEGVGLVTFPSQAKGEGPPPAKLFTA